MTLLLVLTVNDKDKYDSKKYRFVVRRTNKRVICSVIYSTIEGDKTMCTADSKELARYGVKCGLTNYASAYCVGLLCARRLLQQKEMGDMYKGNQKVDGSYYCVQDEMGDRRPFKAYLDVGLVRTTTGNRVFGAMKGACDGGLYIPHNEKRFPGHRIEKVEANVGKKKGGGNKQKKNPKAFKKQFALWEKALAGKSFEDIYKAAHAAIRKTPDRVKPKRKHEPVRKEEQPRPALVLKDSKGRKWLRQKKIGSEMRHQRVAAKVTKIMTEL